MKIQYCVTCVASRVMGPGSIRVNIVSVSWEKKSLDCGGIIKSGRRVVPCCCNCGSLYNAGSWICEKEAADVYCPTLQHGRSAATETGGRMRCCRRQHILQLRTCGRRIEQNTYHTKRKWCQCCCDTRATG